MAKKIGFGIMFLALIAIIIIGVIDFLLPQTPVASLSEGIFEATQIVLSIIIGITGGVFAIKK